MFRFQGLDTRGFSISKLISVPGTNEWYASGILHGGGPPLLMKFNDTTQIFSRMYNFNSPGSTGSFRCLELFPNGDLLGISTEGVSWVTLTCISSSGEVIWRKSHKLPGFSVAQSLIGGNGDIWLTGALTPGQAGAFVAHFSSTGSYITHKSQFKLGVSLEPIRSLLEIPGNQLLTVGKAYYNNSNVIMFNRINPSIDFVCYNYPTGSFSDTTFNLIDSATSQMKKIVLRVGTNQNLPFPLLFSQIQLAKEPVVCVTALENSEVKQEYVLFPNPANQDIQITGLESNTKVLIYSLNGKILKEEKYKDGLDVSLFPSGIYQILCPEKGLKMRFIRK
jgi:hypothetical protein